MSNDDLDPTTHRDPTGLTATTGKTRRAPVILDRLADHHHDATIALHFSSPFQLLVATILSAQATDVKVNEITPALFHRYPDAFAMAEASHDDVEDLIGALGLFRQKARNIQASAALLVTLHDGEVPATMEELLVLPGVARKTANVVLSNAWGSHVGVVVDTHVRRLSRRLRFTRHTDVTKIERDLMRLFPRERWLDVSDLLIFHGRRVCHALRRDCPNCVIADLCPSNWVDGRTDKR